MKMYGDVDENIILKWTLKKQNMEMRARSSSWHRKNRDRIMNLVSKYNPPGKKLAGLAKIKKMVRLFRNATGSFAQYMNINQQ